MRRIALLAVCLLASACSLQKAETATPEPQLPVTRWDHRPEATLWTEASMSAMASQGAGLRDFTPSDIDDWCPGYAEGTPEERSAFWVGLLSALAKHESTWRPDAVGGGGQWFGLVQIDPSTARGYDCRAKSGEALKDGVANLSCAIRIATHQVMSRGTVARGMLDWGPFHSSSKRDEMRAWVVQQPYCQTEG